MIEALKNILKQAKLGRHEDPAAEADRIALENAAIAAQADEIVARAKTLMESAQTRLDKQDRIGAAIYYAEAITLLRANNTTRELAYALRHAADVRSQMKEYAVAGSHAEEAIRLYRTLVANGDAQQLDLANALRVSALNEERQAHHAWREACELYTALGVTEANEECTEHLECLKHHNEYSRNKQEPHA